MSYLVSLQSFYLSHFTSSSLIALREEPTSSEAFDPNFGNITLKKKKAKNEQTKFYYVTRSLSCHL